MKVLHVNNVANVPAQLVKQLRRLGVDAELHQPTIGGFEVGPGGKLGVAGRRLIDAATLRRHVRRGRFDIVHIHYAYFGVLGILGGYDFWLHCHGTDVRRNPYHPFFRLPTLMSLARAKRILYSTPDLAEHVARFRPDGRFLPNPVDTELFSPGPSPPVPRILIISRIDKIKGIDQVLEAASVVKRRHPAVSITAIGWGPDLAAFRDAEGVQFVPKVAHELLPNLIRDHTLILGQVKVGGLGMSELEAMACARPVICNFKYGSWYDDPAPVLQAEGARQMVERIEELLDDSDSARNAGRAGREWVSRHHGAGRVAAELLKFYESYLATAGTAIE